MGSVRASVAPRTLPAIAPTHLIALLLQKVGSVGGDVLDEEELDLALARGGGRALVLLGDGKRVGEVGVEGTDVALVAVGERRAERRRRRGREAGRGGERASVGRGRRAERRLGDAAGVGGDGNAAWCVSGGAMDSDGRARRDATPTTPTHFLMGSDAETDARRLMVLGADMVCGVCGACFEAA